MKYSFDVKISEHIWEDTLGQLICLDAIIAREGYQEYYEDDIFRNGSFKIVKVERPWSEVLKSAPTFEAKPIIIQHPDKNIDISVKNMKDYKVGHMQNVRPSEHQGVKVLIADLVFDNEEAIKKVKAGEMRELSCGYFYEIDPDKLQQYDIKGEHLALVDQGRAGIAKIIDSKEVLFELNKYLALETKESKDEFMSKITKEVLEGIKKYYLSEDQDRFQPEEVELTLKIVNRELEKRNISGMGNTENAVESPKEAEFVDPYIKATDEEIPGGVADNLSIMDIAKKHGISERIIRRQLQKGIKHELEHTKDRDKAKEIAMDHLYEMPNYYTKLAKMENEPKAEDLYVEDEDKITMRFEEDELAWVSTMVREIIKGDIISTIRSIRPFEVIDITEKDGEVKLKLISTDENFQKSIVLDQDDFVDLLVISETGEKVTFDTKAEDQKMLEQIKDIEVGDVVSIGGTNYTVTDVIKKDNGRYDIMGEGEYLFKDYPGDSPIK